MHTYLINLCLCFSAFLQLHNEQAFYHINISVIYESSNYSKAIIYPLLLKCSFCIFHFNLVGRLYVFTGPFRYFWKPFEMCGIAAITVKWCSNCWFTQRPNFLITLHIKLINCNLSRNLSYAHSHKIVHIGSLSVFRVDCDGTQNWAFESLVLGVANKICGE